MSEESTVNESPESPTGEQNPGEKPESEEQEDQTQEEFKSEESKKAVLSDLAKERENRKELQAKVEQFEQAQQEAEKAKLSDIERAQTEAQEAVARAEKAESSLLKRTIAATHGITDQEDIDLFLTGSDEDTLMKQAERLSSRISGPTNPKPDTSQGAKEQQHLSDAEKVAAAEKSGDSHTASVMKAQQLGSLANQLNS